MLIEQSRTEQIEEQNEVEQLGASSNDTEQSDIPMEELTNTIDSNKAKTYTAAFTGTIKSNRGNNANLASTLTANEDRERLVRERQDDEDRSRDGINNHDPQPIGDTEDQERPQNRPQSKPKGQEL